MNLPKISTFDTRFITAMVMCMYAYEAKQHTNPNLLTTEEEFDFYAAYCGV